MAHFWSSVDVALVPSNQWVEAFGMVAIEAMACGKPVVAANNGGLPEVVADGETGRVVTAGDIAALADAVGAYVRDPALRAAHGRNARRRCERLFGIEQSASRYLALCAEVAAAERHRK
jgi:glycosyltransferase involved in cell wall biosynthesis